MERQGSRSQKGPYARKEGRKSFISKMTDSFKDIMYPSWLSRGDKTTPTTNTSKSQDSPQTSSSTASGQADLSNPDQQQFLSQRLSIPNGIPQTQGYPCPKPASEGPPFQSPNLPPPISEFTSSLLPLNRLTEKSDSVLANEDTMSQRSDASKSTSGCSSMVPQRDSGRRDSGVEKRKTGEQESPESRSSPSPGPQPKRQRLHVTLGSGNRTWTQRFNESLNSPQPASNLKRPAFNTSLFGSPLNEDTSVLGTSFHQSSFYPGKTMYGGRSSFRSSSSQKRNKIDLNQSLPSRLSFPVKSFTKSKPRTPIVKEAITSSTAKRILDVLDRMPTPLGDAKKIPLNVSHNWTESPSFFSKEVASTSSGPPTRRLTMGNFASISQNRQTSTGSRWVAQDNSSVKPNTTTSTPSSFTAVGLSKEDTMPVGLHQSQPSGKMRREKSYHRGSASIKPTLQEDDTMVLSPVLRNDFTLPISASPQFNFTTPSFKPAASNSKTSDASIKPTALKFTFSSPIAETSPSSKTITPQKVGGFKFSSPINLDKKDESPQKSSDTVQKPASGFSSNFSSPSMQMNFSTAPKPKATVNGPSVSNSNEGGFKPAGMLKTGSVMDILGGGSSTKTLTQTEPSIPSKPLSSVFKQSGWNCDVCLITNKVDDSKCVACQTPKPGQKMQPGASVQTSSKITTSSAPISAMFKPSGWSCDVCLISNKDDTDKCVACQTPRPGPKKITGQSSMLSKNGVLPGNWVCNTCLIQNKAEDVLCGACKSGKSASSPKVVPKQDDLMAKLKAPSGQWECEVCLIQNKPDANACVACQSLKPQKRFKHPPGDWVCDTCLVNNKENDVKCVACNYSRPGAPRTQVVPSCVKSYSISQPSGFSFPGSSSTQSMKDSSNVVNTGGFKFGTATTTSSNSDFKFGAPSNSDSTSKTSENGFKSGSDSSKTVPSSGFKFGVSISISSDSGKSDNITSTSGFKFGTSVNEKLTGDKTDNEQNNEASPKAPGFQFGSATSNNSSVTQPTGGFKFGTTLSADSSATNTSTGGFQLGGNSTKSNTMAGGFKFGISTVASSTGPSVNSVSVTSNSSVVSSAALVNSSSDPAKTFATPGGFTLPSSGPLSSVTPLDKTSVNPSAPAVGGFNFTSSGSKDTISNNVTSSTFTGLFGGAKASEVSAKKDIQMPVFGASSDKVANTTSTPAFGGFNFAQKKNEDSSSGITSPVNLSGKRGRDEDSGEATAKKSNISFGSSTPSTPFQFGATNNDSQPNSTSFVFGQQNSTTTQAGGFSFGVNKTNDSTLSVFGGAISSTQATSAAPQFAQTNPVFGFSGQKSEPASTSSNLFKFGGTPGTTATPAAAPSFGGANTNSFGTTPGNVFGGNAPSTTPAFGSTPPPAFGSTNMGAVATTTPAFGGNHVASSHLSLLISPLSVSSPSLKLYSVSVSSKRLNDCCDTSICQGDEDQATVLDLLSGEEIKTYRIGHQPNEYNFSERKKNDCVDIKDPEECINQNEKVFIDCESQTDRNIGKSTDNECQTDGLEYIDRGLQTECRTVILKESGIQTDDSFCGKIHILTSETDKLLHAPQPKKYTSCISLSVFDSFKSYSKSLLSINSPVYCKAKRNTANMIQVSATQMRCSHIDITKVKVSASSRNTLESVNTTNLLNGKPLVCSVSVSNVSSISNSQALGCVSTTPKVHSGSTVNHISIFDRSKQSTQTGFGLSVISDDKCVDKHFDLMQCNDTSSIFSLFGKGTSSTSTVLTYSQSSIMKSTLVSSRSGRRPEDSQMEIEVSPIVKQLSTHQPSITSQTAGPSGINTLFGAAVHRLTSTKPLTGTCNTSTQSNLDLGHCQINKADGRGSVLTGTVKVSEVKNMLVKFPETSSHNPKSNLLLRPQLFFTGESINELDTISNNLEPNTLTSIEHSTTTESPTRRKVSFDISSYGVIDYQRKSPVKSPEQKDISKSILKKRTNEMVSAFNSTAMFDTKDASLNSESTIRTSESNGDSKDKAASSSIFGGGRYFHTKSTQDYGRTSKSAPDLLSNERLPKCTLLNTVDKGKVYFAMGKSDVPDTKDSEDGHNLRKGHHNLWTKLKLTKKVDRVEVKPITEGKGSPTLSRVFGFTASVEKPNSIAVVNPLGSTKVRDTPNNDNEMDQMSRETVMHNGPSSSRLFVFSGRSDDKDTSSGFKFYGRSNKEEAMSQEQPSMCSLFPFSGRSNNKDPQLQDKPQGNGVFTFSGRSNDKGRLSQDKPQGNGVFTFSGRSNDKGRLSKDKPQGNGVFTFSGRSNDKGWLSQDKPQGNGVFTFSGRSNDKGRLSQDKPQGNSVFTFSGRSKDKPEGNNVFTFSGASSGEETRSQDDRSSRGLFTFTGSLSSEDVYNNESALTSPRSAGSDDSYPDSSSCMSDTSLSSDSSSSSDSDSSGDSSSSSSSSTSSSSSSSSLDDRSSHSRRMECTSDAVTRSKFLGERDSNSDGTHSGDINRSQNSCTDSESIECLHDRSIISSFSLSSSKGAVFQFGGDQASSGPKPPTQTTSSLFQFGAKPDETAQQPAAAPNAGFNFNTNQAGLGGGGAVPNFNFSQSPAPAAFNFSATATPNNAFSATATPNNAFSATATPNNAFSATATPNNAFSATATPNNAFSVPGERKMKKAVRKLRR